MNLIREFIFSESHENDAASVQNENKTALAICQSLLSSEITIYNLLDQISIYTLDRKFSKNRQRSYVLLNKIFSDLPSDFLKLEQLNDLITLFTKSLETDVENALFVIEFLRTLQLKPKVSNDYNFLKVFILVFSNNKFNTTTYTFNVRNIVYKLLLDSLIALEKCKIEENWAKENENLILQNLMNQTESEKDPRNLILILEIWQFCLHYFSQENLSKNAKMIFEMLSVYFPITFDDENERILINKAYLIELLNTCLSRQPLTALFYDLIFEKLEEQNKEESVAVLKSLSNFFVILLTETDQSYSFDSFANKLIKKLNFLLFEINDVIIEENSKRVYSEFLKFLCNKRKNSETIDWVTASICQEIFDKFLDEIASKPNGKNAHSIFDILLETVHEFDRAMLSKFIEELIGKIEKSLSKKSTLIVLIESVLPIIVKCCFHEKISEIRINLDTINSCFVSEFVDFMNLIKDKSVKNNMLKFYGFLIRVCREEELKPDIDLTELSPNEVLFLKVHQKLKSQGEIQTLKTAENGFEILAILVYNNLEIDRQRLFRCFLECCVQYTDNYQGKKSKAEKMNQLSALYLKGIKQNKCEINPDWEQLKALFVKFKQVVGYESKKERKDFRMLFESFVDVLLAVLGDKVCQFFDFVGLKESSDYEMCFYLLTKGPLACGYFSDFSHKFDLNDSRLTKLISRLILLKLVQPNQYVAELLSAVCEKPKNIARVFQSLMHIDFRKYSQLFQQSIEKLLKEGKSKKVEALINAMLKETHKIPHDLRSPLYRQKLSLFVERLVDQCLVGVDQTTRISIKLSLINFQIEIGSCNSERAEQLNQEFIEFVIQNEDNIDLQLKYLVFVEHLIEKLPKKAPTLFGLKIAQSFMKLTQTPNSATLFCLTAAFLRFLGEFLKKSALKRSDLLSKKILVYLHSQLENKKRIVRNLAGNALNLYVIYVRD